MFVKTRTGFQKLLDKKSRSMSGKSEQTDRKGDLWTKSPEAETENGKILIFH